MLHLRRRLVHLGAQLGDGCAPPPPEGADLVVDREPVERRAVRDAQPGQRRVRRPPRRLAPQVGQRLRHRHRVAPSCPAITSSSATPSATVAAIGPWVRNSIESSGIGQVGILPSVGFIPNVPHIDDGAVIEPAESVPVAPGRGRRRRLRPSRRSSRRW